VTAPPIRYATNGDIHLAYQTIGDGPRDLVLVQGAITVSQTVKDLAAGSGIEFEDRGARELKGIPGEWRLYAISQS